MLLFHPKGRANKRPPLITPLMPISLKLPGEQYLPFVYGLIYRSIMISRVAREMSWPTEYYAISSEKNCSSDRRRRKIANSPALL